MVFPVHGESQREPVGEASVVTVGALLGGAGGVALVGQVGEGYPEDQRGQHADRRHPQDQALRADHQSGRKVAGGDGEVVPPEVARVARGQPAPPPQPEEPLVGHGDRPERQVPETAGLQEEIRVAAGLVRVPVVEQVRAPEVGEGHQAGQERDPPPEGVAAPGGADQPVDRFVGHDGPQEGQPGAQEDVGGPAVPGGRDDEQAAEPGGDQAQDHCPAQEPHPPDRNPADRLRAPLRFRRRLRPAIRRVHRHLRQPCGPALPPKAM